MLRFEDFVKHLDWPDDRLYLLQWLHSENFQIWWFIQAAHQRLSPLNKQDWNRKNSDATVLLFCSRLALAPSHGRGFSYLSLLLYKECDSTFTADLGKSFTVSCWAAEARATQRDLPLVPAVAGPHRTLQFSGSIAQRPPEAGQPMNIVNSVLTQGFVLDLAPTLCTCWARHTRDRLKWYAPFIYAVPVLHWRKRNNKAGRGKRGRRGCLGARKRGVKRRAGS